MNDILGVFLGTLLIISLTGLTTLVFSYIGIEFYRVFIRGK